MAKFLGLALPKKSGRRTRSQSEDPWRSLCNALKRKKEALKANRDKEVWALWLRMHRNDCSTYLARALREDPGIVHHGLDFFAGRTLLFLASWRDRPKCVKMLLNRGASPEMTDDLGCSPLIVASWAGAVEAVGELVKNRPARRTLLWRGEPPQQSSCGGRAPYTALQWALRKSGVATSWPEKERAAPSWSSSEARLRAARGRGKDGWGLRGGVNNGRASLHSNSDGPFCRRREDVAAPSRKTGFPCCTRLRRTTRVLGTSLPPVGTHIGLASYSSSIRRSARRPLLSP